MPKKLKTRVALKTDNYENWAKAVEFVPMAGEVIVYTKDGTPDKIKIGDGSTTVVNLPFFAGSHTLEVEAFASEEVPIKLVKPDGTVSQVVFKAGSNITLVNNGDNKVIISADQDLTKYENHINDKNNPHEVILEQLGYTLASEEELIQMLISIGAINEVIILADENDNALTDENGNELAYEEI